MRATLLLAISSIIFSCILAQDAPSKPLQSLINAELSFAEIAKTQNTRDAFLKYLSAETVMFMDGLSVGKKAWQERKPDSSLLIWEPVFADISASGDFGFTTGPSEYYPTRRAGEQGFFGSYISMWRYTPADGWKLALDIGVYPQPKPTSKLLVISKKAAANSQQIAKGNKEELMKREKAYLQQLSTNTGSEYSSFISDETRFLRAGAEPVVNRSIVDLLIKKEIANIN